MKNLHPAIVLVDDEPEILFSFTMILRRAGFEAICALGESGTVLPLLEEREAGVVILDLQMPVRSGRELLAEIVHLHPDVPVVVVTGANDLETAVECMKAGAFEYLVKPVAPERLASTVRKSLEVHSLRREVSSLRESLMTGRLRNENAFAEITTRCPRMKAIFGCIEAVAPTDQPVLVTGETGVGKELAARAVHFASGRQGKFVAINAAGLDDLMFSDTLFGHRKGAFSGADDSREGMVARAAGGTLFLDEIGDLSPASQVKLLRLLQENEYYPLGSDVPLRSTARVVVATNRDPAELMGLATFRKDLYYRLQTHQIQIPPLRERREDLPLLLEHFLAEAAESLGKKKPSYPPELLTHLATYPFPGNVREFKGMVYNAMARHRGGVLSLAAFLEAIGGPSRPQPRESSPASPGFAITDRFPTLQEVEEYLVAEALARSGNNQRAAANLLGISRQALNKRLSRR